MKAKIINNSNLRDDWKPSLEWSDQCSVQWGKSGIVISKSGNYKTSFFEVFPSDGSAGFIRGQGNSIDDAELSAFKEWKSNLDCLHGGGHSWSRTRRYEDGTTISYNNGGCFCVKCNAFKSGIMKPIVDLGAWKRPLSIPEVNMIGMGFIFPDSGELQSKYMKRMELRARRAGMKIPNWKNLEEKDRSEFNKICHFEVALYYVRCHNEQIITKENLEYDVLRSKVLHQESIALDLLSANTELIQH